MEYCAMHKGPIKYLILEQKSVKLACVECKYERDQEGKPTDKCITIKQALQLPEVLLSKINIDVIFKSFYTDILQITNEDLNKFKNSWIGKLQAIKDELEQLTNQTNNYFDTLSTLLNDYREKLKTIINFNVFEQYLRANENNTNIQQSAIVSINNSQIEQKIQEYINSIENVDNQEIKKNMENQIKDYKFKVINLQVPSSEQLLHLVKTNLEAFQIEISKKSLSVNPPFLKYSKLLSNINFEDILFRVSKRKNSTASLIYQGSQDGLETIKFWNKVQNKSNLLMIMKSKNNTCIFGGYSPCQWLKSPEPKLIPDERGSSFLFIQYPNSQINYYPIKSEFKHEAIGVNQSYGPIFGKADLIIYGDFKEGMINIGQHYFRDQKENYQSIIFGPKLPEIIECEIYQV